MDHRPRFAVADAYAEAWRLKGKLIAVHIASLAAFAAMLSPLVALALSAALRVSGQPALTDKDIALFVLSPAGAIVMTAVAALFVAVQIVGFAGKMAVLSAEHAGRNAGPLAALRLVAGQGTRLVRFALSLVLRIAVFIVPALAIGGACALFLLGEYDINFYLAERPPAFLMALGIGAVVVVGLALLLVPRLLSWALTLPMVLLQGTAPRASFSASAAAMKGRRWRLLARVALWAAAANGLSILAGLVMGAMAGIAGRIAGDDVERLAPLLLIVLIVYVILSTLVSALNTSALAHLLLDEAGWPVPKADPSASPVAERRIGWLTGAAAVVAGLLLLVSGLGAPPVAAPQDITIIAHRGGAAERPENTMAAMELGMEQGADWLEIDVQENADGEVIVVHDSDFMKLAGVPTKVWNVTSDELATIDIGSWFSPDHANERTASLRQVLEAARDRSNVLIELKYYGHDEALAERTAEIVEAAGMTGQVAAMSLYPPQVARMKELRPDWQVGLLAATALGRLERLEADFLAVSAAIATPRLIRDAQEAGKEIYVWTINDAAAMARMAGMGVSGVITDRPGLAREVFEDLATLSPAERLALSLADRLGLAAEAPAARDASP